MSLRTPLYQEHIALNARMVDFGGWEMPVQYQGVQSEHEAVRTFAGIFDVSHMGEVEVKGSQALDFLQQLVTNNVGRLKDGQAIYSPMCYENGTIVDDLIIYRLAQNDFFLIINASNIQKDVEWMKKIAGSFDVIINNVSDDFGMIALQGPKAESLLQELVEIDISPSSLNRFSFIEAKMNTATVAIARTGYTGEDGFEICAKNEELVWIWKELLRRKAAPCGLGARDTLRLECAMMLYGNDIDTTTTPLEAPLGWTVFWEKEFVGKSSLLTQKNNGVEKKLVGIEMLDRGIARQGYPIVDEQGNQIGRVTSGTQSPTLKKSIALAYVPTSKAKVGEKIFVKIRENRVSATIVKIPFYKRKE